jgi:oxygen-independent coproporphyrinogen-3 oxidase
VRYREPRLYMENALAGNATAQSDEVSRDQLPFEFMLNALRLVDGFDVSLFTQRTGLPLHIVESRLASAEKKGLLARDWKRIGPTERGRHFLNELLEAFLPDTRARAPASG